MLCLQVQAEQPVHEKFWTEPNNQAFLGHSVMEFEDGSADSRAPAGSTEDASKQTLAFQDFYIYNYKADISEFKACLSWFLFQLDITLSWEAEWACSLHLFPDSKSWEGY